MKRYPYLVIEKDEKMTGEHHGMDGMSCYFIVDVYMEVYAAGNSQSPDYESGIWILLQEA